MNFLTGYIHETFLSPLCLKDLPIIDGTKGKYVSASSNVSSVRYLANDVVLSFDPAI